MVTYRVYQKQLNDRLQVQFIYENSPVFAGTNELSILIRFRYTGNISSIDIGTQLKNPFNLAQQNSSEKVKVHTEYRQQETSDPKDTSSTENGWFGSRLSTQLSNATRSLFLKDLNSVAEEDDDESTQLKKSKEENQKITLFLGYAQILGHYLINDTIIDYSIFKDLEKSTIIEGKYAGISGLDAHFQDADGTPGLFSGLSTLYNTEMNASVNSKMVDDMKFIPFYSTNQNIVFSELIFDPDQWTESAKSNDTVKSFYINCQLPKDLPPTYSTEAVQINYNFILGYQMMEGNNIVSKTVFAPLKIQPFIDNCGRQPVYNLGKAKLNNIMENLIIEDVSNHPYLVKHDAIDHNTSESILVNGEQVPYQSTRRISFFNLKKKMGKNQTLTSSIQERRRSSLVNGSTKLDNDDQHLNNFLNILDTLDKTDVNGIIKVQEEFESMMNETKSFKFNVRENLMQILADYKYAQRQKLTKKDYDEQLEYDYILPKEQQTKYILKQDHGILSTLTLNKGIFKLGDLINLNISFEGCRYETKGIEIQLLKHQVFHREEYLKKGTYDEVSSRLDKDTLEIILFEKVISTFNMTSLNTDILIPLEAEPQFKTNFFHSKYCLQIRFILIDTIEKSKKKESDNTELIPPASEEASIPETEDVTTQYGKKILFDMKNIFTDTTGSMLFRAREHLDNASEFYVRVPVVVLPTYEQDFGIVTTKI